MLTDLWVIVMLIGDIFVLVFSVYAVGIGVQIARKWDIQSSTDEQLLLERKTHLVSTVMNYVFGFQMISLLLFVVTVNDHFPALIKGAMCGTGALNTNSFGWMTLYLKIGGFFIYGLWLVINNLDQKIPEFPLTRQKFYLLLILIPFIFIQIYSELQYYLNINPNIITTCCSISFGDNPLSQNSFDSSDDESVKVYLFYGLLILYVILAVFGLRKRQTKLLQRTGYMTGLLSPLLFIAALDALIVHFSKYIYAMPSHHCPFDMLWANYLHVGYLLYGLLFTGSLTGMSAGLMVFFSKNKSISDIAGMMKIRFIKTSLFCFIAYTFLIVLIKYGWTII